MPRSSRTRAAAALRQRPAVGGSAATPHGRASDTGLAVSWRATSVGHWRGGPAPRPRYADYRENGMAPTGRAAQAGAPEPPELAPDPSVVHPWWARGGG